MKTKLLNYLYKRYPEFFKSKVKEDFQNDLVKADLTELYEKNKQFFELLSIKDFVGYIPKEVNEPVLKIFESQGEILERWILWQSWYINRRAISDPKKIDIYNGMSIILKVFYSIASVNKKDRYEAPIQQNSGKVEEPWIDKALNGINEFNLELMKRKNGNDKTTEDTEVKSS